VFLRSLHAAVTRDTVPPPADKAWMPHPRCSCDVDATFTSLAGVSRVVRLPHAAECNKAPFMYEMKGALFGYAAPARPVAQLRRSSSAGCPAAPFQFSWLPSFAVPVRLVPSRTVPGRPVARPSQRHAPPACAGPRGKYRFPGLFRAPGEPPGWCPFPAVKTFLRPSCPIPQELAGIRFEFFSRPHVVHRIPSVIRASRRVIHRLIHSLSTSYLA